MHPLSSERLDSGESLPRYYGVDRLVLLPRDPYWLFAYWEISTPTRNRVEHEEGTSWNRLNPVLRVYRYNAEGRMEESFFETQLLPEADNWYIKAGVPDRKYYLQLGCRPHENVFKPILTSNTVTTPRDDLSDVIDENWRLPDWQSRRLYWRISRSSLSSLEMMAPQTRRRHRPPT